MLILFRLFGLVILLGLAACSGGDTDSGGGYSGADYRFLYEHNAQYLDGHTIRWESNTITVYTRGIPGAEAAVNRWAGPVGFVFINTPPSVGISFDWTTSNSYCGLSYTDYYTSGRIVKATIYINENQTNCRGGLDNTLAHETAHALGFFSPHTSDGGLLDPDGGNGAITPAVRNFFGLLYSHSYGWDINPFLSLKTRILSPKYRSDGAERITRVEY